MKKTILLHLGILTVFVSGFKATAQNADEMIFNQYLSQYNYVAGSFVIDTGISQANNTKRAFLIWANNLNQDTLKRYFSLSEYDGNLNFLTEQGSSAEKSGNVKNMFPKKIIKSKFEHAYYLLAYTTNSKRTTNGFKVYSSPVVYKIDGNTLGLVWASKINLAGLSANNLKTVIEYNDMIETRDKNIVLVGKYADSTQAKEFVLSTKLKGSTGALAWQFVYQTTNKCNEAANSVAETTDGRLSLTGYIRKCVIGQTLTGNADLFYMQVQANGIPVPGIYERFFWPSGLNIWGDKITCYTSSSGSDQLIISGYIDIQDQTGGINRQILVMNLKESGTLVTAQHIGGSKTDVCNDLIFNKNGSAANEFLIYLTGQTASLPANTPPQVYYMSAKFNTGTGITGITEISTFPNTTYTKGSRNGIEIKNAGDYKKFAILATGVYQPVINGPTQTYSDVLIRDLADANGNCIKEQQMALQQFNLDRTMSTIDQKIPPLKIYGEKWQKLATLFVKEPCQHISVDPYRALNIIAENKDGQTAQTLRVTPNPVQSVINLTTADGSKLTGNAKTAVIEIYNYAMQVEKMLSILPVQGNSISIPVTQLKPGVYWVQVTRGGEKIGCSFVKE